jgi:hypothetical protein
VDSTGRIFVAWHDCAFRSGCGANDIVFSTSADGATWSAKTRVPIDATTSDIDHFLPGIGVDPVGTPGRVGVVYYYYPVSNCGSSCQLHVGFISSGDSGATWGAPMTLAGPMNLNWIANTTQGRMVGDYFSTSFVNHEAHPVFIKARSPVLPTNRFEELVATAGISVALGPGPRKADRPRVKRPVRSQPVRRTRAGGWLAKQPSLPTAN